MSLRGAFLAVLLAALAWGFWRSGDFTAIAAGVAIFLFGMMSLERGFRGFTGGTLEALLHASTSRLWKSIGFGIASTTLMQSSTLVSLVTISVVSAQMITLAGGIGVILGTNLGTTTGAWLIAGLGLRVNISAYAMPLLVVAVTLLFQRSATARGLGHLLLGVGFLFLGIHFMKEGFEAFQQTVDLSAYAMGGTPGLLLYVGIGLLVTVLMQSSHATLLVVITALAAGQVTYDNALALAIGANLGTAVTTALGGLTAHVAGKRLAVAHVAFNIVTALVAVVFFDTLRRVVDLLGDSLGFAGDDHMLRLALFHTLFNLVGVVIFAPFTRQLAGLLERYVTFADRRFSQPRFLHRDALKVPEVAVAAVRSEVLHLYDNAFDLIAHGLSLRRHVIRSGESLTEAIARTRRIMPLDIDDAYEQRIKSLHSAVVEFISEGSRSEMPLEAANDLYALRQASQKIVLAVKDMKHLHKNLSRQGLSRNPAIRQSYDAIRRQIAGVLREVDRLRAEEPQAVTALSLDAYKVGLERFSQAFTEGLEEAIRRRRMTATEATSLMNDVDYAYQIGRALLEAAQTLLVPRGRGMREAHSRLALSDEEVREAAAGSEERS